MKKPKPKSRQAAHRAVVRSRKRRRFSRLLATVARLDGEIARLPGTDISDVKHPLNELFSAWVDAVATLELGPQRDVRECAV